MKSVVAVLSVLLAAGCSRPHSPVSATTPTAAAETPTPASSKALRGTVSDADGQPLQGATVEWAGAAEAWGDRGHGVRTNEKGEYRIAFFGMLPPGGYGVARASKAGYDQQTKPFQVSGETVLNFVIARFSANGSVTMTSATRAQPLCPEIVNQVGKTSALWLVLKSDGGSVTVALSHDEPPTDDPWSGSIVFSGTRSGDTVFATYEDAHQIFGCSTDSTVTAYGVRRELKAEVAGNHIAGQYTEVYGTGEAQATFAYRFQASF